MTTKDEALKMAIRELECYQFHTVCHCLVPDNDIEKALNACKEALEQPAQEPVAWMNDIAFSIDKDELTANKFGEIVPLYTHPTQPLSDEAIKECASKLGYMWTHEKYITFAMDTILMKFARAIEAHIRGDKG